MLMSYGMMPALRLLNNSAMSLIVQANIGMQDHQTMTDSRITLEPGKRGGRPCIRGLRISVYDVLEMLADGMSEQEIIDDFPELEPADIRACLAFAADREHNLHTVAV